MEIITIIGARPQCIKAAMVSRAIINHNRSTGNTPIEEKILHTGQHYDENMNHVFFKQLNIPQPTWQLQCGQGSHAEMTAQMLVGIEKILLEHRPAQVLVYGDTNSTLAGALAASKLHIPVIHVEAGLRSFNKQMPEEINRILTDHLSGHLFCPTFAAVQNLQNEGLREGVFHVGDVMYDAAITFGRIAGSASSVLSALQLTPKQFYLCTAHRAENTDDPEPLTQIIRALGEIAHSECPVIWPLHPRTKKSLEKFRLHTLIAGLPALRLIDPVDYLDMVMLEKQAVAIFTDSGGVQKEAYFHRTPCITLRSETEWVETVAAGWNQLAGCRTEQIIRCLNNKPVQTDIPEYGDGNAAGKIVDILLKTSTDVQKKSADTL
ncbi:MAG: UDP-N-acetylglucosamine 2-epimerase (non-hydrolyzing) [Tannerella sp.]|jgi:UDP-GlcNAc3NAcA epimerase|nr:UDP-N-acetylglucosamine 2-epimerase (non-hydrolyzing) [Tannerella sp.]